MTVSAFVNSSFSLQAELLDRALSVGDIVKVNVSANAPAFYRFDFGQEDRVTIHARSSKPDNNNLQAVVSLQNGSCPIYDLPSNVQFTGIHQSIVHAGSFYLTRNKLGKSVYVVVVVRPSDQCGLPEPKEFEISVQPALSYTKYGLAVVFIVSLFFILPFLLFWVVIRWEKLRGIGFNELAPPKEWILAPADNNLPQVDTDDEDGFVHVSRPVNITTITVDSPLSE